MAGMAGMAGAAARRVGRPRSPKLALCEMVLCEMVRNGTWPSSAAGRPG